MDITVHGLDEIAADLSKASLTAGIEAAKVTAVGARKIRDDARRFAAGIAHAPNYPRTITYDLTVERAGTGGYIEAEIGPDKDLVVGGGNYRTPGNLGNILEYGTARNAPQAHLGPAFDREVPNWLEHLEGIVGDVL